MSGELHGPDDAGAGMQTYLGLRSMVMSISPEEIGIPDDVEVFGVIMDTTYPNGTATLIALADGTVSLYTSTGGGVIGGGAHDQIASAGKQLIAVAESHMADFESDPPDELPPAGWTLITARTRTGPLCVTALEDDFGYRRHPASPVFHAAHAVITELRQLEESRSPADAS